MNRPFLLYAAPPLRSASEAVVTPLIVLLVLIVGCGAINTHRVASGSLVIRPMLA